MFSNKCKRCERKILKDYDFCPYCGINLSKERTQKDYGFLGKDDFLGAEDLSMNMPFGLGKVFSNLMNELNNQMRDFDKPEIKPKRTNSISISISTADGKKPEIRIAGLEPEFKEIRKEAPIEIENKISNERLASFSKLPRQEAQASVRRMSNKIVYEIHLPGVKDIKNILINQLENSIEIKAFSKDKVYVKLIPLNLPILNYKLNKDVLIVEFKSK